MTGPLHDWLSTVSSRSTGYAAELAEKIISRSRELGTIRRTDGSMYIVAANHPDEALVDALGAVIVGFRCAIVAPARADLVYALLRQHGYSEIEQVPVAADGATNRLYADRAGRVRNTESGQLLFLTSGTTSGVKLVPFEQAQVISVAESITSVLCYSSDDTIISALPVSFDYGFYQYLLVLAAGGSLKSIPRFTFLGDVAAAIAATNSPCIIPVTPAYGRRLAHYLCRRNQVFDNVRLITSTGAPFSMSTRSKLHQAFPVSTAVAMYGLTECKRIAITPPEHAELHPTSVGTVIPGVSLRLVGSDGLEVTNGQPGEAVVSGFHVAHGYWEHDMAKPEHTRTLRQRSDGEWELWTGDELVSDSDRFLYYIGRTSRDFVKILDEKVSLLAIEEAARECPAVLESRVVADFDEDGLCRQLDLLVSVEPNTKILELRHYLEQRLSRAALAMLTIAQVRSIDLNDNGKLI